MDDELKNFLGAMQRRSLDKRLDDAEQRAIASEECILARVDERIHALETKLLTQPHSNARRQLKNVS